MNIDDYEKAFNESLENLQKTLADNEVIAYTFGSGRIIPSPLMPRKLRRGIKEAMNYIKSLDGFLGVNPLDIWRTLLIFDTLNHAKSGRNLLRAKDISCGEIMPIAIPKEFGRAVEE